MPHVAIFSTLCPTCNNINLYHKKISSLLTDINGYLKLAAWVAQASEWRSQNSAPVDLALVSYRLLIGHLGESTVLRAGKR